MKFSRARVRRAVLSLCALAALAACGRPVKLKITSPGADSATSAAATDQHWRPAGAITLSWTPPQDNTDGSTLHDLAGYKIYSGSTDENLDLRATLNNPGISRYVVDQPAPDEVYFAITSFNYRGLESDRSVVYLPPS